MKKISIVGDSISTYIGMNPLRYSVFYDEYNLMRNKMTSVNDTWWAQVISFLDAQLCVNNSYSGSLVSGLGFPSASSDKRTSFLHNEDDIPDIILIYIGFNDFGNGVKITREGAPEFSAFYDSYVNMINKIKKNYPKARIICSTLLQPYIYGNPSYEFPYMWGGIAFDEYNDAIRKAAKITAVELADLENSGVLYETLDGAHPTKAGHETIAGQWIEYFKNA